MVMIRECLQQFPAVKQAKIFGSRAMGTYKKGSDIDIVLFCEGGKDISASVKGALDELPTPYLFDVVDYDHIEHQGLKDHIEAVAVAI